MYTAMEKRKNHLIEFLFAFMLFAMPLNHGISTITNFYLNFSFVYFFFPCMYLIGLFSYCYSIFKKPIQFISFYAVVALIILLSIIFQPDFIKIVIKSTEVYDIVNNHFYLFIGVCIPIFALTFFIADYKYLFKLLYRYGILAGILNIIAFIIIAFIRDGKIEYMSVAYNGLLAIIINFYFGIKYKKPLSLLISLIGFITLFIGGGRGALLSATVFIGLYFIFISDKRKLSVAKMLFISICVSAILLIIIFFKDIVIALSDLFEEIGYESRIINFLIEGKEQFTYTKDRDNIKIILLEALNYNPFGFGIFGDKILLYNYGIPYAHNFIYEVIIDFGILFGGILLFILFILLIRVLIHKNKLNNYVFDFIIILLPFLLIKLLLSSSFTYSLEFWVLISLLIKSCNNTFTTKNTIKGRIPNEEINEKNSNFNL